MIRHHGLINITSTTLDLEWAQTHGGSDAPLLKKISHTVFHLEDWQERHHPLVLLSRVFATEGRGVLLWQHAPGHISPHGLCGRAALSVDRSRWWSQGLLTLLHHHLCAHQWHPTASTTPNAWDDKHCAARVRVASGEPEQTMEPQHQRQHGAGKQGCGGQDLSCLWWCFR